MRLAPSPISMKVNGREVALEVPPLTRLSAALRDTLGLTGTKVGCDAGDCGACTVLIDGEAACACLVPTAQAAGADIRTVEGLASGELSALQASFLRHGAAQCGICTPGFLVAGTALLEKNPHPTEDEVKDALGGVLCRCTGYRKIVTAVMGTFAPHPYPLPVKDGERGASALTPTSWTRVSTTLATPSPRVRGEGRGEGQRHARTSASSYTARSVAAQGR